MRFCERPFQRAFLAPDGEVKYCPWMNYVIGNLYEQDLGEIWHSEAAERARQSILNGSFAFCRKTSCRYLERDELPDLAEEELQERAVPSELPEDIQVCNDRTCNIACTSCRDCTLHAGKEERERIDGAMERLLPFVNKAKFFNMNGQGEFLAIPSYIQFLGKLQPERPDFSISFETNGTLFDEAHWAKFSHLEKFPISVTVTLNSLKREVYRYLSGGFDFLERELDNIRFMSKLRREGKINHLEVTMVVQEANCWEVPEYIRTFAHSEEFTVDAIVMKPLYNWFKMDPETYWFKNILNPLHPYHKEYLKILADDCWKEPKVFDWGCHNIRHAAPHPLSQEKIYNQLLLDIYQNEQGLSPSEFLRACMERVGGKRVGYYGKNDFSRAMAKMLLDAGIDLAFQLTWGKEKDDGLIPKVAKQEFRPDMADVMLIIDFHKGHYWFKDLPALGFQGSVLSIEEFLEGGNGMRTEATVPAEDLRDADGPESRLRTKKLGFGCLRLPLIDEQNEEVDQVLFNRMVDRFMEEGFNYFETGHTYLKGNSETALREGLVKRYPRESFFFANKLAVQLVKTEADVHLVFQEQLDACGVEYFDCYLLQGLNERFYERFMRCNAFGVLSQLKAEGKVRHMGISFHDKAAVLERILRERPEIEVVQIQLNYADCDDPIIESGAVYEVCRKFGKPVLVMEPVRGGGLSYHLPDDARAILEELHGGSLASYAIRYAASFEGVITVLSGMSTMEQVEDNISYMKNFQPLTRQEMEAIDKVRDILKQQDLIPCTGCRYCMSGCPQRILIPRLFTCMNVKNKFKNLDNDSQYVRYTTKHGYGKASDCIGCGQCEQACPQRLPVMKLLKDIAAVYEHE